MRNYMSSKPIILIVDDEPAIRDGLSLVLEEGYEVLLARDGIDAAHLYLRNIEQVAALVTDFDMPRLNGRFLIEWVHHIRPHLPVIIMTTIQGRGELTDLLRQPTVSFLSKPFQPAQIHALLDSVLRTRRDEAA